MERFLSIPCFTQNIQKEMTERENYLLFHVTDARTTRLRERRTTISGACIPNPYVSPLLSGGGLDQTQGPRMHSLGEKSLPRHARKSGMSPRSRSGPRCHWICRSRCRERACLWVGPTKTVTTQTNSKSMNIMPSTKRRLSPPPGPAQHRLRKEFQGRREGFPIHVRMARWIHPLGVLRRLKQGPAMPIIVGFPTCISNYDATTWPAAFEVAVEAHAAVSISILLGFNNKMGTP